MEDSSNIANVGDSVSTITDETMTNSFGSRKTKTKFIFIGGALLIAALIIGLVIGLYFHKGDKKCEPCVCPEPFSARPMRYKISPILNPLVGPRSQRMEREPTKREVPMGNSTFPPKFAAADQPYASDNFAMHN